MSTIEAIAEWFLEQNWQSSTDNTTFWKKMRTSGYFRADLEENSVMMSVVQFDPNVVHIEYCEPRLFELIEEYAND